MSNFVDIEVDGSRALSVLGLINTRALGLTPLMLRLKPIVENVIEDSFDKEASPSGQPWAALAASSVRQRQRKGQGGKLLQRTGEGKRSVKVTISGNRLYITYLKRMEYHQTGTRRLPKRQFSPEAQDFDRGALGDQVRDEIRIYLNPTLGQFTQGAFNSAGSIARRLLQV